LGNLLRVEGHYPEAERLLRRAISLEEKAGESARLDLAFSSTVWALCTAAYRINARGMDRSKFGLLVEAERPIPTGTLVSVETAKFTVLGRASVQHCSPNGMNYRIGLYMPDRLE
jgi:hypothetical protein